MFIFYQSMETVSSFFCTEKQTFPQNTQLIPWSVTFHSQNEQQSAAAILMRTTLFIWIMKKKKQQIQSQIYAAQYMATIQFIFFFFFCFSYFWNVTVSWELLNNIKGISWRNAYYLPSFQAIVKCHTQKMSHRTQLIYIDWSYRQ